ncbi:MAG: class I SAM-dependent methyltransferase [Phycisphaerae bacterium]|nr:class I SAM-dependent methyltransferase [Phycisphaerae bacterium]
MANPAKWYGMKYPDGELVGLAFRFARPSGPGLSAIDIGCGSGRHVKLLADLGYAALGLDNDPKMVEQAIANGQQAQVADLTTFRPADRPHLAVAWGLMMLVSDAPKLIAALAPQLVIADWRTEHNSCLRWPANEQLPDGRVLLRQPGHTLDSQQYFFHTLAECEIPGYERVYWQRLTKTNDAEVNDWYQTVHRRK